MGPSSRDARRHDPGRGGGCKAVGCLESGESVAEQFLQPWPNRRCVIARESDGLGCWPDCEVESDRLVEVASDPDRKIAAAERDLAESGREQLAAERVGIRLGERPRAAAGLIRLLWLLDEGLDDLLRDV